jgi:dTDP-4-dehydrorhamnose reductase
LHLCATGETSWHGFASAIVDGLRTRDVPLAATRVVPIATEDFPTRAVRPRNSRLSLDRLYSVFGIKPETWEQCLQRELNDSSKMIDEIAAPLRPFAAFWRIAVEQCAKALFRLG